MPDLNVFVTRIVRLKGPLDAILETGRAAARPVEAVFEDGGSARLGTSTPQGVSRARILDELRKENHFAYVEVDPISREIGAVLIPRSTQVEDVSELASGDILVLLHESEAKHYIRRVNPNYDSLRAALEGAKCRGETVLVTEAEGTRDIIDVRPHPGGEGSNFKRVPRAVQVGLPGPVTPARAKELFELVNGRSCNPGAPAEPCIPFLYPDGGCWVRAHEMCRLIAAAGEQVGKLWIYGDLVVKTANSALCTLEWVFHVAPCVDVQVGGGVEVVVLDPALAQEPVAQAAWKALMRDVSATLVRTDATPFLRKKTGEVEDDPDFRRTEEALKTHRLYLLRDFTRFGPQPYARCS